MIRITLRLPEDLHKKLVDLADNRPLNGEIVQRLEKSLPVNVNADDLPTPDEARRLADQAVENYTSWARDKIIEKFNKHLKAGVREVEISTEDIYSTDLMSVDFLERTLAHLIQEFSDKGYKVEKIEDNFDVDYKITF